MKTQKQITFSVIAATIIVALAGCGSGGEVEMAAPESPVRTNGTRPMGNVATGPMPESLKRRVPPTSPNNAKRNMAVPNSGGRSAETEARKID